MLYFLSFLDNLFNILHLTSNKNKSFVLPPETNVKCNLTRFSTTLTVWSQRLYGLNECILSMSVWSLTFPRSPSYVDAYTSHDMTPARNPPRHPTDTPPPVVRCHVIDSEMGMTQEPTTTPRALKSQPTSMSMARMMSVMGTSRQVALATETGRR